MKSSKKGRSGDRRSEGSTNGHPDKLCARCGRPFAWRKKWERDWDSVRYCSDRCRMGKGAADPA